MQRSQTLAILLLVCAAFLITTSSACNDSNDCDSCKKMALVKKAASNMSKIMAMLATKKCESWRKLHFKTVSFTFQGSVRCRSFLGKPYPEGENGKCAVAEAFDLSIDEEIADEAKTAAIDNLAREGQLECEPNGTMVFNRGNVRFSELDSLYQPYSFYPVGFGEDAARTVGFEVFFNSKLVEHGSPKPTLWCHEVQSAFMMIYDVVNAKGKSVLLKYV